MSTDETFRVSVPSGLRSGITRLRRSPLWKGLLIAVLTLFMLIPLDMASDVIRDREGRYRAAVGEIGALWGGSQVLHGPILAIPFEALSKAARDKAEREGETATPHADVFYLLPDSYRVSGDLAPERRRRGLFETVVYRADLSLAGDFAIPPPSTWHPDVSRVLWDEARILIGVTDPRSIGAGLSLNWAGKSLAVEPGAPGKLRRGLYGTSNGGTSKGSSLASSLSAPVSIPGRSSTNTHEPAFGTLSQVADESRPIPFQLVFSVNGSKRFDVLPLGRETEVSLSSSWASPSFDGAYLPVRHEIGETGFEAEWSLSYFGRGFPQHWLTTDWTGALADAWRNAAFGVRLFQPVGAYRQAERTAKYGILFLVYTFGLLYLFEQLGRLRLHIVHYGLVGLSLCLFYLLLLSLAEHLGFALAYLIASTAVIGQIGLYTWGAVGSRLRSLSFSVLLAALYAVLYVLMQLETYALLSGSVGLFVLLAAVMAVARRIDWEAAEAALPGHSEEG